MKVVHRNGKQHQNADALSRIPDVVEYCNCYRPGKSLELLPCKGCSYCERCMENWSQFEEEIDDVSPLCVRQVTSITDERDNTYIVFQGLDGDELNNHRRSDPDIGPVIIWLETEEPSEAELFLSSPNSKFYWLNKNLLTIEDGILKYKWISNGGIRKLVVLPRCLQKTAKE